MSQFDGKVYDRQTPRKAVPNLETRKADAIIDWDYNYTGVKKTQRDLAEAELKRDGESLWDAYSTIWGFNKKFKDLNLDINDKPGHIHDAPKTSLIVKTKNGKKIQVSNYGSSNKNDPSGMIDAHDLAAAGHAIDVNGVYSWSSIQSSIPEETKMEAYKKGALREFTEEIGLTIPDDYHSRIVYELKLDNRNRPIHTHTIELENAEYEALVAPLLSKTGQRPQPEISAIYFKKYLKYKNKYLQLKKQLK